MRISSILDSEKRSTHLSMLRKQIVALFKQPCPSKPIFVLGRQRSGTTMLMRAFHNHPDTEVFDEAKSSVVFNDYQIRSFDVVRNVTTRSKFPFVCFKPIADSHKIMQFRQYFPNCHVIWSYRDFRDSANSAVRKFVNPTRAIKIVCSGGTGGGWFQDGLSEKTVATLRKVYQPDHGEFELECLVWWARNQIIIESGLIAEPWITLVKYEAVVTMPRPVLSWLFSRIGIPYVKAVEKNISPRSIGRDVSPPLDSSVEGLCRETADALDRAFMFTKLA